MISSRFPSVFPALDAVVGRVNQHTLEPKFSSEVLKRESNCAGDLTCETKIFAGICEVIAYSNGSQSALVEQIIANSALASAL